MTPFYPERKETIIVVHGINSSRHNFDTLIPSAMLAQSDFNVLLILMTLHMVLLLSADLVVDPSILRSVVMYQQIHPTYV